MTNRRDRKIEIRVSSIELAEIDRRLPRGTDRSAWLREIALGHTPRRRRSRTARTPVTRHGPVEMARVRALCANAEAISEVAAHARSNADSITADQLEEMRGHVRALILSAS